MEEKSISSLIKLLPVKDLIFQPKEYNGFFELINNYVAKYGEFPNNGYLDSFFDTERTSDLNDVWSQIKDTNSTESPTMAMVDLQITHNLRSNVISMTHATNVQLKSSNNSDSNEIVHELQTNINDLIHLSDRLNTKGEILNGTTALANLKDHHNRTAEEGYYISKYGSSLSFIDDVQGGLERAGFIGILASAKQRKSTLLRQIIYNQAISGKNCGLITLEMALESIREHLILLHASNSAIWGYSHPYISMSKVRSGGLTKEEKEFYYQVADDLFNNPAYGKIHLLQPTGMYTFDNMKMDFISLKALGVLIVGIDYLSLVKPRDKGRIDMDDYNDMIMNTRYLGLSLGQTYLTPIQANRDGFARALKMKDTPVYDINSIHLYSGFEKGCTSIISVIQTDAMRSTNTIAIGSVVNREAPPFEPTLMTLHNDSGTFLIGQPVSGESIIRILDEIDI